MRGRCLALFHQRRHARALGPKSRSVSKLSSAFAATTAGAPCSSTPAPVAVTNATASQLDGEALRFVEESVSAGEVVMFALEWCEFCWSARKLFDEMGVAYRSIDLDAVAFQEGDEHHFVCEASGSNPAPTLRMTLGDHDLS